MSLRSDNSGFTMIEIMIAAVILAIAMLALMSLGTQGISTSRAQAMDSDFNILFSNIELAISSDCSGALTNGGSNSFSISDTPNEALNPIKLNGFTIAQVGLPTVGVQVSALSLNQYPIYISQAPNGNKSYKTNLHIEAQKVMSISSTGTPILASNLPGAQTLSKDIPVIVWVNSSNIIVGCLQQIIPVNVTLTLSCGTGDTASGTWTVANPTSVYSAELQPASGSPVALPGPYSTSNTINPFTAVSTTYTLILTDQNGNQTYGFNNPTGPAAAPVTCP